MRILLGVMLLCLAHSASGAERMPILFDCSTHCDPCKSKKVDFEICSATKKSLAGWWKKAFAKNYFGQHNLAWCLYSGCGGAVERNPAQACAWVKVLFATGTSEIEQSDHLMYRKTCEKLSQSQLMEATGRANQLFLAIYDRPLQ